MHMHDWLFPQAPIQKYLFLSLTFPTLELHMQEGNKIVLVHVVYKNEK